MTPRRLIPLMLLVVAAGCSKDAAGPATGPRTTTNSVMAASTMPLLGAKTSGAALDPGCAPVVGTFYGAYQFTAPMGWVGTLYLSIAGGTVETPTFLDQGSGSRDHGSRGMFSGTETNTISFPDGTKFDIDAKYNAQPTGTPELFVLHETGTIVPDPSSSPGTRFAGVSGHVAVDGPFTLPPDGNFQWIAQMHGSICGLQ